MVNKNTIGRSLEDSFVFKIDIDTFEININYISIFILVIITVLYFVLLKVFKKNISSIQIILISGVLGIILSYILE